MRTPTSARLDRLQTTTWPDALAGDARAIETIRRILACRARLLGLDRPPAGPPA